MLCLQKFMIISKKQKNAKILEFLKLLKLALNIFIIAFFISISNKNGAFPLSLKFSTAFCRTVIANVFQTSLCITNLQVIISAYIKAIFMHFNFLKFRGNLIYSFLSKMFIHFSYFKQQWIINKKYKQKQSERFIKIRTNHSKHSI